MSDKLFLEKMSSKNIENFESWDTNYTPNLSSSKTGNNLDIDMEEI